MHLWSDDESTQPDFKQSKLKYKSEDGVLVVHINGGGLTESIEIDDSQVPIHIDTQAVKVLLSEDERIMTLRFQLKIDISLTKWNKEVDNRQVGYKGPKQVSEICCKRCGHLVLDKSSIKDPEDREKAFQIKVAPSQNMGDLQDLWQCHNENYSLLLDPVTHHPVKPLHTLLIDSNLLHIPKKLLKDAPLKCP